MKALLVISKFPPEYSGPGVRMPKLYSHLKSVIPNFSFEVLCNGVEQTKNETYIVQGMKVTRRSAAGWPIIAVLPTALRLQVSRLIETVMALLFLCYQSRNLDFIHIVGNSGATAAAIFWANIFRIPMMLELVNARATPYQRFFFINIRPHERATIVSMTEPARQACIKAGYGDKNIWLRPNPVDEKRFYPALERKQNKRSKLSPFSEHEVVIVNVGKIIPRKNQIFLIDVLPKLPEKFKLVIAGPLIDHGPMIERDAAYLSAIHARIEKHNLQSRVHVHVGYVDTADYIQAADIYAVPAMEEGFGTPTIEAIACAVPVVANSDEPAFCEWVVAGKNGYLASVGNLEMWAEAIQRAVLLPKESMLEAAREIVQNAGQTDIFDTYVKIFRGFKEQS